MQGHKAGLSLAFFPFNNGNSNTKEIRKKEKKVKKGRSNKAGSGRFGLKLGVNFSDVTGTDVVTGGDSGYRGTEFYGGFFVDTKIAEKWSVQTEATFSYTDDLLFIETPVLLKMRFAKKWAVFAGPKTQILLSNYDSVERSFGLGIDAGFQYDLLKDFFIEARYGVGLTEQINDKFLGFENGKRNVFRVGVGIKF
jgi:hypothetical protein